MDEKRDKEIERLEMLLETGQYVDECEKEEIQAEIWMRKEMSDWAYLAEEAKCLEEA